MKRKKYVKPAIIIKDKVRSMGGCGKQGTCAGK